MATPLTQEQLQAGFDALARHRPSFAYRNLAHALTNPLAAAMVRMHAVLAINGVQPYPDRTLHRRPVVCAPVPPLADRLQHRPVGRDNKRAAAGDRDDD